MEELAEKQFAPIHIIGGGTKNRLLNQFTANATNRVVVTGPVEATAIGNVLMQAIGLGHLGSLNDARAVVRASFEVEKYQPVHDAGWQEAYSKILALLERVDIEND
jgi:sugar (pentulose or hexulose) kinase